MQTLPLRFRDLRAISPGQSPSRWRTPSPRATNRKSAPPLPDHLQPTSAVGSPAVPPTAAKAVAPRWRWRRRPGIGAERLPQHARASVGPAPRQACVGRVQCAGDPALPLAVHPGTAQSDAGRGRRSRLARCTRLPSCRCDAPAQTCGARASCVLWPRLPLSTAPRLIEAAQVCGPRPASSARAGCSPDPVQVPCRSQDPGRRTGDRAFVLMLFPAEVAWPATTSR
jgi:hypothetical protein